jgi:hypothetical protein
MSIDTPRVLVVFEPTARGGRALRTAVEAAAGDNVELTVVTLAPQVARSRGCMPSAEPYNRVVREEAELELRAARELVWASGTGATFKVLADNRDPPLEEWIEAGGYQLVLLPRHRLSAGGHPAAGRLRRSTRAEVRLVG